MKESTAVDFLDALPTLREQGRQWLQLNRPDAALDCFDRALEIDPSDVKVLTLRGNALQDLGRFDEAVKSYDSALQRKSDLPATLNNRGNALRALRRYDEALASLNAAIRARGEYPEGLNNRGSVLKDLGRLDDALASFCAALELRPDFVLALCNRGYTLLDLQRAGDALASFETALRSAPGHGEALFGRASALLLLEQRFDQALADFEAAAAAGIQGPETFVGKAAALTGLRRHSEAADCLSQVLALQPDRAHVLGSLVRARLQICSWTDLTPVDEIAARLHQHRNVIQPQSLLSLSDEPQLQLACSRLFVEDKYAAHEEEGMDLQRVRAKGAEKIRVAYVSADFCDHPVSHLLVGVLEKHDRERFEIIGVSLRAGDGGALEQRVRGAFDRFVEVNERSDREAVQLLRELQVDIAVDLMGFTQGMRLGLFAQRVAAVQVNYLGYAGTLGAPYMDYVLADGVVIPAADEGYYSEQVVRLPHCYLPNDDQRAIGAVPTREQAGLPPRGMVFCAFTNAYKLNPPMFDIWMRLLQAVPESVLWLRGMGEEARGNLQREAQRRGVSGDRLVYAPHVASMADHLGRQTLADLYLDTLPYNAHSTSCDALWSGVPVLTCVGRSFAGRVAASALTAVGLPELITHSLEEYEHKALQLAQQPQQLQQLRERLARHRTTHPLFDTPRFTRHLESAFLTMHQRALAGEAPKSFNVLDPEVCSDAAA